EPVVAPGAYACPAGAPGQAIGITFLDARGRPLAHAASDSASGCRWLTVSVGGRRGPALLGGWDLPPRLWTAGSLIRCTAAQITVSLSPASNRPAQGSAQIAVHNVARSPCSLKGDPTIELMSATGRRLPVADVRAPQSPSVATAPGHAKLLASVTWRPRPGHCSLPSPASASIGLPGIARRFDVAVRPSRVRLGPCSGRIETAQLLGVWTPTSHDAPARS
ncbi:MAG: DUF4232 domain-containing protein, partial [Solirubrobacteraceae bacterium]